LFQVRADAAASPEVLTRHVMRLMRGEEQMGLEAPDEIARQAVETFQRVAAREDIRTLLASGACLYEVPFSLRLPSSAATPRAEHAMKESGLLSTDGGGHLIVRGTIDALVRQADGAIVVIEFKTGAPHVDHNEQLEMYVEAARAMFPGAAVTGRLIYP
jgi:ATP-dependent exoDNAse (exonuclease V) beta subunit